MVGDEEQGGILPGAWLGLPGPSLAPPLPFKTVWVCDVCVRRSWESGTEMTQLLSSPEPWLRGEEEHCPV